MRSRVMHKCQIDNDLAFSRISNTKNFQFLDFDISHIHQYKTFDIFNPPIPVLFQSPPLKHFKAHIYADSINKIKNLAFFEIARIPKIDNFCIWTFLRYPDICHFQALYPNFRVSTPPFQHRKIPHFFFL